jgi:hypothetical protein
VQILNCSYLPDAVAYECDRKGQLRIITANGNKTYVPPIPAQLDYSSTVDSLAEENEAGCYKSGYFTTGGQEIGYIFKLHPPVEYDEFNSHLNIMLAAEHLPYEQVEIVVHDPEGYIERLFFHPEMQTEKRNNSWIITGRSSRNELLEVEMLLRPEAVKLMAGFPKYVSDVKGKTLSANQNITKQTPHRHLALQGRLGYANIPQNCILTAPWKRDSSTAS